MRNAAEQERGFKGKEEKDYRSKGNSRCCTGGCRLSTVLQTLEKPGSV